MMHDLPKNATVAIIAAYNPPAELVDTIAALKRQVEHVIVVDDGSGPSARPVLDSLVSSGIHVIFQNTNSGIAAALNAGVAQGIALWQPEHFLTLDQDSVICEGYVDRALSTLRQARAAGLKVGFVTAESYSGHFVPVLTRKGGFAHGFDPMQSGFLVPRETFTQVGTFAEEYFIDGVDSEFTMRARAHGLDVLIGNGCTITHNLGERSSAMFLGHPLRFFGRTISYNYHSPARVYYICRNGTLLTKTYLRSNPNWVLRRLTEESKAHALRLAFSPNKHQILLACVWGFRDALRGSMGKIPSNLKQQLRK